MQKLKDKPFALIGVNLNGYQPKELKAAVEKEKLTWRSFADPGLIGQGPIAAAWNYPATPTLYVIDPKGIIRHKWVGAPGEKVLDAALEKRIQEAESNRKQPE